MLCVCVCVCVCSAGAAVGAAAEVSEDPGWREAEWKCHSAEEPSDGAAAVVQVFQWYINNIMSTLTIWFYSSASQTVIYKPLVVHETFLMVCELIGQKGLTMNEMSNYLVYNLSIVWGQYIF